MTDFDQTYNRNAHPTMKTNPDQLGDLFGNRDALPFWVADMDFQAPPAVIQSLQNRAAHGIYGYEYRLESTTQAIVNWYATRQNWTINPDHIEIAPSVLSAIAILIDQHSDTGDGVIVQPPVFFEFRSVIRSNQRRAIKNTLQLVDGAYQIDFDDLETKAADPRNKIMIVCNPHNPVGRVWSRDELARVVEICDRHDVLVIADEIHGDIVYPPHTFTPMATVSDNVITCLSPAKTFNIAGMIDAMVVIADDEKRAKFHDFAHRFQINKNNVFSNAAIAAAYGEGGAWLDELLAYLQGNVDHINAYLAEHIPSVSLMPVEGTYLVWLDFTALDMDAKVLARFLGEDVGIALNPGHWFGREGAGYGRMNIASPRATITAGLDRLRAAVDGLA